MSYIDVMSDAAYGRYNRKLAKLAGLPSAVYWSELLDIIGHVVKKQAFDEEGYFKVDREYVEERTGLTDGAQKDAEGSLIKLGALAVHPEDPDRVGLMCEEMFRLLTDTDPKAEKKVAKTAKLTRSEKAAAKRAGICQRLKNELEEEDPELRQAYCDWIDVVYGKGIVKSSQVKIFRDSLEMFPYSKEAKLEILQICTTSGYREAQWGIEKYERIKSQGRSFTARLPDQKIATEDSVNKEVSF